MKTRLIYLFIFLFIFLLTPLAISGTWTDTRAINAFSVNGTTVSTSQHLPGMMGQAKYWVVTGYASISGTADPLGDDDIYEATIWLEASGKDAAGVPGRGNIDTSKDNDEYRTSTGAIRYATGTVASVTPGGVLTDALRQMHGYPTHGWTYALTRTRISRGISGVSKAVAFSCLAAASGFENETFDALSGTLAFVAVGVCLVRGLPFVFPQNTGEV